MKYLYPMDNIQRNKQIAINWIGSFNEGKTENLLKLYDENAIHFSPKLKIRQPETKGWIRGKEELGRWWEDAFERLPTLRYELKNLIINEDQVLMEYLRKVTGEEDMMVAEILEISNNLIIRSRVYHG